MNTRKLLAIAVLAALPTVGTVARQTHSLSPQTQASWMYALGMEGGEALAMGITTAVTCAFFVGPGAAACGIVGAL